MPSSRLLSRPIPGALVALAASFAFVGALGGEFVWDDLALIARNARLAEPDGWKHALTSDFWSAVDAATSEHRMYRPLVSLAYWIQYQAFGGASQGFHLVSLVLHTLCGILAFRWLCRRLRLTADNLAAAIAGTLVFALHPSRAESVAWVSGSTDVWMLFFVLIGLEFWDRAKGSPGVIAAFVAFSCAFFCKEVAIVVPALLLGDAWLGAPDDRSRRVSRAIVIGIGLGAILLLRMRFMPMNGLGAPLTGMATRVLATLGGFVRFSLVPWPTTTQFGYLGPASAGVTPSYPSSSVVIGAVAAFAFVSLSIAAWRRPSVRPWLADTLWFLAFLLPVMNFILFNATYYANPRYLYAPGLGLAALAARFTLQMTATTPRVRTAALAGLAVVLSAYFASTTAASNRLASGDRLWSYEYARNPRNHLAAWNLMLVRMDQHRWDEAQDLATQWTRIMPTPEDKGHGFGVWLSNALDRAIATDDLAVEQVHEIYESAVAGLPMNPSAEAIARELPPEARRWLATSSAFQLRRSHAALLAGHFELARRILDQLANAPATRTTSRIPLILTNIVMGDLAEANRRIDEAAATGMPLNVPLLRDIVAREGEARLQGLTPTASALQLSASMTSAGDTALARSILVRASGQAPGSVDLLKARLQLELTSRYVEHARETLAQLRKLQPVNEATWKQIAETLEAER